MKVAIQTFIFLISTTVFAQNLVQNPSFEDFIDCPNALGTFSKHVKYWSTPTAGTSDYFNKCSVIMGAPENFNGEQEPIDGRAYAGIYFYAPADYREYVQNQLRFTLREGLEYELSFYASLAEGSDFAIKDFGIVLSEGKFSGSTKQVLSKGRMYKTNQRFQYFEVQHDEFHENKSNWFKVKLVFRAKGFERFLSIGNLRDNKMTRKVQTKRRQSKKGAYYYIDNLRLTKIGGETSPSDRLEKDSLYVLRHVNFDFDKYELTPKAVLELERILERLLEAPKLQLQIHAHTDDLGSHEYNNDLSKSRANSIADFFVLKGIEKERIHCFGHGSTKPLVENSTEEQRKQNRRAEFIFKSN
ncbi:OmpA family protein [Croceivirga thetidis]|uniref:OmpA family protein n=1 Tax=Croceivirga thetidis TaxID=2721623 RepID=A0ABX1GT53_9FLAO|nr:OmpA family protein [Croceivirga thetidis]NKI33118.1 OmpA family protein [Croceivirga thetidis]